MNENSNEEFQVFTVHDPRFEEPKSVVYVGLTGRKDLNPCFAAVIREHLSKVSQELLQERKRLDFKRQGPRTDKPTASQRKADLIMQYQSSGSNIKLSRRGGGLFTISEAEGEIETVS